MLYHDLQFQVSDAERSCGLIIRVENIIFDSLVLRSQGQYAQQQYGVETSSRPSGYAMIAMIVATSTHFSPAGSPDWPTLRHHTHLLTEVSLARLDTNFNMPTPQLAIYRQFFVEALPLPEYC